MGALADKCAAFAKALHYKEIEFQTSPATTCEALISINNQLDLPEAAVGILLYAQQNYDIELKESWYEKLQRWDQAKEVPTAASLPPPQRSPRKTSSLIVWGSRCTSASKRRGRMTSS